MASAPLVPGRANDLNSTSRLELIVSYPNEEEHDKLVNDKKSNLKYTVDAPHPLVREGGAVQGRMHSVRVASWEGGRFFVTC